MSGKTKPVPVDIQVHKTKGGKWRAELRGPHTEQILFFYDNTPSDAALQAIQHLKTLGDISRVELAYKNARAN